MIDLDARTVAELREPSDAANSKQQMASGGGGTR